MSLRHSSHNREPTVGSKTEERRAGHDNPATHFTHDQAEHLASKIVEVGSDYITHKTEGRFTPDEISEGPSFIPVDAMANKLMKEGAREMERMQGTVVAGSDAALAQSVHMHKDDPSAPQHEVAEKIRERVAAAEEHEVHDTFQGVNPHAGIPHNSKLRHFQGSRLSTTHVSATLKEGHNPDVIND